MMPGRLTLLFDAMDQLSQEQRQTAENWMIGMLAGHVTEQQWADAVAESVAVATRRKPGSSSRPNQETPRDRKTVSTGERDNG